MFDVSCWVAALFISTVLRYELDLRQIEPAGVAMISGFGAAGVLAVSGPLQVYWGRHSIGTVGDAISVSTASALVGSGLFVINVLHADPRVPRTVPLIATLIALVLAVGVLVRLSRERKARPDRDSAQRVIVFGAGSNDEQLVKSMLTDPHSGYLPVALLDDHPNLRWRCVSGVAVRAPMTTRPGVAAASRADVLVVAKREVDAETMRMLAREATRAGFGVKVLPPLIELLRPWVGHGDLRDLDIADLLGRRPVQIDLAVIGGISPDGACSSPVPAARLARSCAGRSTGTAPRSS